MYNDTIKVANKIISDKDLREIFQKMNDEIQKNNEICRNEKIENEKYEREYQHWTTKNFEGKFKCEINFYDDTTIKFDDYVKFITVFNNRLSEIKSMYVTYRYSYEIKNGSEYKYISKSIIMDIREQKMSVDVNISSEDDKMKDIYQLIKDKIVNAPSKYTRIIKKKNFITSKIQFAAGAIPSLIICALLAISPAIRNVYAQTYILYPIAVILLSLAIGGIAYGGKLSNLYSTIVPEKKYDHFDSSSGKSVYKDDMDKYLSTSEILIGKNADNISKRRQIRKLEKKFNKYIPIELFAIVILTIIMIIIGNI